MLKFLLVLFTVLPVLASANLADLAMQQPGVDMARYHIDNHSYMVAIQPSTTSTQDAFFDVVKVITKDFASLVNDTGYKGKLQIGITDRPGRVVYMLDISASDSLSQCENDTFLRGLFDAGQTWQDDTRNYDPYGNRYTEIPNGKGLLGSMVMPWLGYTRIGEVWYDL